MELPYLTHDLPGIGGSIRNRPEDFFVQELPLYEPSGEGEHVYCEVQKVGITTFEMVDRMARALKVPQRDIGYAGMKDAQAVTRQVLSIRGATPEAVMGLHLPDAQVQWAARHGNKLRLGHLKANRFAIKVRDVQPTDVLKVKPIVDVMLRRGMPNYFGEQRFGRRDDNDALGAALVRGDDAEVLRLLLGNPLDGIDDEVARESRAAFERGELETAHRTMPRRMHMEARVLHRYMKSNDAAAAVRAVDERVRKIWVSALQSRMFNDVTARRVEARALDRVQDGDLAWKHDSGAVFLVESAEAEQPRCDAFDISPSGPLVGYRMTPPTGEPLASEQAALDVFGLKGEDFRRAGDLKVKGARRPLRVKPEDVQLAAGVDEHGAHITVAFTLPAGSFATVLLREVMKVAE